MIFLSKDQWDALVDHPLLKSQPGQPRLPSWGEQEALHRMGFPSSSDWMEWAAQEILRLKGRSTST